MNIQQFVNSQRVANQANAGVTVSVIAWKSAEGISIDWYFSPSAADRIYEVAKGYCHERANTRMSAIRRDVVVSSYEHADEEILELMSSLFAQPDEHPLDRQTRH